jgi:hypothetical protein
MTSSGHAPFIEYAGARCDVTYKIDHPPGIIATLPRGAVRKKMPRGAARFGTAGQVEGPS